MEIGLLPFDQGSIAAILYPECDVAEKFGVEGLKDTDLVFSVIVYADRSFLSAQYSMDTEDGEEHFGYEPTEAEKELMDTLYQKHVPGNVKAFIQAKSAGRRTKEKSQNSSPSAVGNESTGG